MIFIVIYSLYGTEPTNSHNNIILTLGRSKESCLVNKERLQEVSSTFRGLEDNKHAINLNFTPQSVTLFKDYVVPFINEGKKPIHQPNFLTLSATTLIKLYEFFSYLGIQNSEINKFYLRVKVTVDGLNPPSLLCDSPIDVATFIRFFGTQTPLILEVGDIAALPEFVGELSQCFTQKINVESLTFNCGDCTNIGQEICKNSIKSLGDLLDLLNPQSLIMDIFFDEEERELRHLLKEAILRADRLRLLNGENFISEESF